MKNLILLIILVLYQPIFIFSQFSTNVADIKQIESISKIISEDKAYMSSLKRLDTLLIKNKYLVIDKNFSLGKKIDNNTKSAMLAIFDEFNKKGVFKELIRIQPKLLNNFEFSKNQEFIEFEVQTLSKFGYSRELILSYSKEADLKKISQKVVDNDITRFRRVIAMCDCPTGGGWDICDPGATEVNCGPNGGGDLGRNQWMVALGIATGDPILIGLGTLSMLLAFIALF